MASLFCRGACLLHWRSPHGRCCRRRKFWQLRQSRRPARALNRGRLRRILGSRHRRRCWGRRRGHRTAQPAPEPACPRRPSQLDSRLPEALRIGLSTSPSGWLGRQQSRSCQRRRSRCRGGRRGREAVAAPAAELVRRSPGICCGTRPARALHCRTAEGLWPPLRRRQPRPPTPAVPRRRRPSWIRATCSCATSRGTTPCPSALLSPCGSCSSSPCCPSAVVASSQSGEGAASATRWAATWHKRCLTGLEP
mmetsp:Transcript_66199/g.196986  ORF Transcript_66199/g.196986 Transcript_66199/m.196986 type:complete len:251 (+) Transcript_66199:183-935(+)